MAEWRGFEPPRGCPPNDLANRPLEPLEYHTVAERVGFEPTVLCSITGFQDQLLKPLGHLSVTLNIIASFAVGCQIFCLMAVGQRESQYRSR